MKRILVPLDGSPLAEDALSTARQIAAKEPTTEVVLCAVGELAETAGHAEEEREALMRILDHAAATLPGTRVRKEVRMGGGPAEAIVHAASELGVREIVMSTHSRTRLSSIGAERVARQVMALTTIPVRVVEMAPGSRIGDLEDGLRGTDCSEVRNAAMELAHLGRSYELSELTSVRRCLHRVFNAGHQMTLAHAYLELVWPRSRPHAAATLIASNDEVLRDAGLDVVSQLGPSALPELVPLTGSPSADVQSIVYEAIRYIGGREAIGPLVRGLQSGSVGIRWAASHGLIDAGDDAIVPVLRALVEQPGSVTFHRAARRVLVCANLRRHDETLQRLLDSLGRNTTASQSPGIAMELVDQLAEQSRAGSTDGQLPTVPGPLA